MYKSCCLDIRLLNGVSWNSVKPLTEALARYLHLSLIQTLRENQLTSGKSCPHVNDYSKILPWDKGKLMVPPKSQNFTVNIWQYYLLPLARTKAIISLVLGFDSKKADFWIIMCFVATSVTSAFYLWQQWKFNMPKIWTIFSFFYETWSKNLSC